MKTKFATALLLLASSFGFAQEGLVYQPASTVALDVKVERRVPSYTYLRMGIADNDPINSVQTLPGLGIGYRYGLEDAVLDVSANYTRQYTRAEFNNYAVSLPVKYLHYWSPSKNQSVYFGGGLSWNRLKRSVAAGLDGRGAADFSGLGANASVGYEMNRTQAWRSFVQFDVMQPALAVRSMTDANYDNLPGPVIEGSFGIGF